jgi:hypothetical protein
MAMAAGEEAVMTDIKGDVGIEGTDGSAVLMGPDQGPVAMFHRHHELHGMPSAGAGGRRLVRR